MAFQLFHVLDVDRLVTAQIGAPLADLVFERATVRERGQCPSAPRQKGRHSVSHRRGHVRPDATQGGIHYLPLPPLGRQLRSSLSRDAVILAPAAALRAPPLPREQAETREAVQDPVQHAVRSLQLATRQFAYPFED